MPTWNSGCIVTKWDGLDSEGIWGYPWMTKINCPKTGDNISFSGVNVGGPIRIYLSVSSF